MHKAIVLLEKYQKERLAFAQAIADLAPKDSQLLFQSGVLLLLRPLLLDSVPAIQQAAANALAKLAAHDYTIAQAIVQLEILPHLLYAFADQNKYYKKSAALVLRSLSKHSTPLAKAVVDAGALDALTNCLEDFDPFVKEAGAWAIGYIARHHEDLAKKVVDCGAVPLLILCIQEPEIILKRVSLSALNDIAKHSPELAQNVKEANAIPIVAPMISHSDAKVRRQACAVLAQLAKHNADLAECIIDADIFPHVLVCLKDIDPNVRRNAALLLCEVSKHTAELAQLVVNSGAAAAVVDYISETAGSAKLPGILCLGYMAAFSETLAMAVIVARGVAPIADSLIQETDEQVKAASAWSLGQIGRHSAEHAGALLGKSVLARLLQTYLTCENVNEVDQDSDLKTKTKRALRCIIEKTLDFDALEPMLQTGTPESILRYVLAQFAKILPNDAGLRRAFVTSGALQRLQELAGSQPQEDRSGSAPAVKLSDLISSINQCFPDEVIKYYSPGYSSVLLSKLDAQSAPAKEGSQTITKAESREAVQAM